MANITPQDLYDLHQTFLGKPLIWDTLSPHHQKVYSIMRDDMFHIINLKLQEKNLTPEDFIGSFLISGTVKLIPEESSTEFHLEFHVPSIEESLHVYGRVTNEFLEKGYPGEVVVK